MMPLIDAFRARLGYAAMLLPLFHYFHTLSRAVTPIIFVSCRLIFSFIAFRRYAFR